MPNYAGLNLVGIGLQAEVEVASILRKQGHIVIGLTRSRYDLLCDGKVRVEVKVAREIKGECIWAFNNRKSFRDSCDIVILVAKRSNGVYHFILPSDHDIFYLSQGIPKAGIGVALASPNPKHTGFVLQEHLNNWQLVDEIAKVVKDVPRNEVVTIKHKTHLMVVLEQKYSKDIIQILIGLYQELGTQCAVASRLGIGAPTLSRWKWRLGLPLYPTTTAAAKEVQHGQIVGLDKAHSFFADSDGQADMAPVQLPAEEGKRYGHYPAEEG